MIERNAYLRQLTERRWNDSIKVITGIRRCGKSFLMNRIFYDHLLSVGEDAGHIIRFAFDSALDLEKIGEDFLELESRKKKADPRKFLKYIKDRTADGEKYTLLLDEVQQMEAFETVLNGLSGTGNMDIYVTGSNSRFLSTDMITEFRGRGDEIHVQPLSFSEYYAYTGGNADEALQRYMTFGGLPGSVLAVSDVQRMKYLSDQLEKTYLKDVIERNRVRSSEELA